MKYPMNEGVTMIDEMMIDATLIDVKMWFLLILKIDVQIAEKNQEEFNSADNTRLALV